MKPLLTNLYTGRASETYFFEYFEADSLDNLPSENFSQVAVMAFHKDKLLVVNNITKPGYYGPVGGHIEKGETAEEAVVRETKEESNMKVLNFKLIGYQVCTNKTYQEKPVEYQLRYVATVEPYGSFEGDPDNDVTELLEINLADYKKYFDWGEIGEVIMKRALELKNKLN